MNALRSVLVGTAIVAVGLSVASQEEGPFRKVDLPTVLTTTTVLNIDEAGEFDVKDGKIKRIEIGKEKVIFAFHNTGTRSWRPKFVVRFYDEYGVWTAYSGEIEHPFRSVVDHRFRSCSNTVPECSNTPAP
jgi:hypothetical protein